MEEKVVRELPTQAIKSLSPPAASSSPADLSQRHLHWEGIPDFDCLYGKALRLSHWWSPWGEGSGDAGLWSRLWRCYSNPWKGTWDRLWKAASGKMHLYYWNHQKCLVHEFTPICVLFDLILVSSPWVYTHLCSLWLDSCFRWSGGQAAWLLPRTLSFKIHFVVCMDLKSEHNSLAGNPECLCSVAVV